MDDATRPVLANLPALTHRELSVLEGAIELAMDLGAGLRIGSNDRATLNSLRTAVAEARMSLERT